MIDRHRMPLDIAINHAMNQAQATPTQMALARTLHRAGIADEPDRQGEAEGDFSPAPLYLSQAIAITQTDILRQAIRGALDGPLAEIRERKP